MKTNVKYEMYMCEKKTLYNCDRQVTRSVITFTKFGLKPVYGIRIN